MDTFRMYCKNDCVWVSQRIEALNGMPDTESLKCPEASAEGLRQCRGGDSPHVKIFSGLCGCTLLQVNANLRLTDSVRS